MEVVQDGLRKGLCLKRICEVIKISDRTLQRWKTNLQDGRRGPINHPRKLSDEERAEVISTAVSEKYVDLPPSLIVTSLADDGVYIASESTFYRLLKKENLLGHRSRAKKPQSREKVETIASRPNQVWCWDITNLRSLTPGFYYKLYLFEDLYSRKIVGWDVLETECDGDAIPIFQKALANENISAVGLRLHSDNGNPMRGSRMLFTMLNLGVRPSFSRPSVSNDNAFIESLFKTMKYAPQYPTKPFNSLERAKKWVEDFVIWYNSRKHSGINFVTPLQRHNMEDKRILESRRLVYQQARLKNPLRWIKKIKSWNFIEFAALNPYGARLAT
ncbi:MAG: IS3 family transposase [Bdellovibrio sp.]